MQPRNSYGRLGARFGTSPSEPAQAPAQPCRRSWITGQPRTVLAHMAGGNQLLLARRLVMPAFSAACKTTITTLDAALDSSGQRRGRASAHRANVRANAAWTSMQIASALM